MPPDARRNRTAIATIAVVGLILAAGHAAAFKFEIPKPTGFVVDESGVLSPGVKKKLVAINQELEQKTGAQIAIVVVPSTKPEPPFDYAMAIAESWKPGSAEKDNGVVFLVATADRKLQILTGYGAEGVLPDGFLGQIRDRVVRPAFRAGDYGRGILEATVIMADRIAKDAGVTLEGVPKPTRRRGAKDLGGDEPSLSDLIFGLIMIFFFLGFRWMPIFPGFVNRRTHGHYGGGSFGGGGAGGGW